MARMPARTVALLVYEQAQVLDVLGPAEVFAAADGFLGGGAYDVRLVSMDGQDVIGGSGLRIGVSGGIADLPAAIDTFVAPGSHAWRRMMHDTDLQAAVLRCAARSRRVAAVCAGAFLLGAVGLLDGRRATTHWMFLPELAELFPDASPEDDPIYVQDGHVFTSAGGTSGIDLALALVEADHGAALARDVARYLVVFLHRPGGQAQFSVRLQAAAMPLPTLRALLDEIVADPAGDHRLGTLSARAGFSERHLTRVFLRELGVTPGRYVAQVRLEAARGLLESSPASLPVIAQQSGFRSAETLRRTFLRELGVTPHAYRRRFQTTGVLASA